MCLVLLVYRSTELTHRDNSHLLMAEVDKLLADRAPALRVGVAEPEGAGRGLFAARAISAGEEVLRDWAVVAGPLPGGGDTVCSVCLAGEEVRPCPVCGLPVCKVR